VVFGVVIAVDGQQVAGRLPDLFADLRDVAGERPGHPQQLLVLEGGELVIGVQQPESRGDMQPFLSFPPLGWDERSRPSTCDGRLLKRIACFFGSSATCYFWGNGSVGFVPLEFLPSLPFRKQADINIS
jgi:hypothetical protein